ncbi:Retrovirus-related Pol polyprotein from transposon TNT 1-94 [Cucumis melo var. makuwa]|uniref:Retrovirus-related Pol polyprotein from transposon TNT 1-94 n=1 Tax=Cucumis melo var. makuwa TaxID=1194695 RepID=A0A5D3DE22_CUCMM|nr:Retrovirus-related Pol polyprotein from transposon TNT 1-94 [Cucumis melo var. makuwa]TYK21559.1 Retrovirus-related Pol polyprotein from transposon TNT 1-94 [Cucumis melo var. makuwa]
MSTLTNLKFDGSRTIHEHILEMTNLAARLKTMGMEVNENFLVTFILNSLPSEYGPFHMNYNTLKDKWNVHELQKYAHSRGSEFTLPISWVIKELERNLEKRMARAIVDI